MPRQAKISIPHPVPETVSDRKSRFLFFILAWGRRSKTPNRNFTPVATSGDEVMRWERVEGYLKELGVPTCGHDAYVPENISYRLAP